MNSFIHKILSEFLQPFRYVGIIRVSPVPVRDSYYYLVLGFWLVHATYRSLRTCLSTLSLDTIAGG